MALEEATRRVEVVRGGAWNAEVVERDLGVRPLPVRVLDSPVLLVDGRVEPDATDWLREKHIRGRTTADTYAAALALFVEFFVERKTTLRAARRTDVIDYVNRRTVDDDTRVSGSTFSKDRTVIKGFYEWLQVTHHVPLPITIDVLPSQHGVVTSMREGRGVPKATSDGTPLEPPQVEELVAAAWRLDSAGRTISDHEVGPRDAAFIQLGLACGGRADTLAHLLTYELPDLAGAGDLTEMRLPAATAKTKREVRLPAFTHRLKPVLDYANPDWGARRALLKGWTPKDPIVVADVQTHGRFRGIVDDRGRHLPFYSLTAEQRRRVVTPEGEPAMLFLAATSGGPLAYNSARAITGDVAQLAIARAAERGEFFPYVHTHDLRHTYATHLAALFYLGVVTGTGLDMHGRPNRVDVESAVKMAAAGLGHLRESTTMLYIQQVGMMALRYSVNDFLGRR